MNTRTRASGSGMATPIVARQCIGGRAGKELEADRGKRGVERVRGKQWVGESMSASMGSGCYTEERGNENGAREWMMKNRGGECVCRVVLGQTGSE